MAYCHQPGTNLMTPYPTRESTSGPLAQLPFLRSQDQRSESIYIPTNISQYNLKLYLPYSQSPPGFEKLIIVTLNSMWDIILPKCVMLSTAVTYILHDCYLLWFKLYGFSAMVCNALYVKSVEKYSVRCWNIVACVTIYVGQTLNL